MIFSKISIPVNHWIIELLNNFSDNIKNDLLAYRFNEVANKIYQFVWHLYCDWYVEFTKSFINDSEETRHVSAYVFSKILILLHPIAPFNTEYLYSKVHKYGDVIALEKWPTEITGLTIDEKKLNEVKWIKKFITEIRSLRNILNIPFKSLINIHYESLPEMYKNYISKNTDTLKQMVRVNKFYEDNIENEDVAQIIVDQATFYIPLKDLIDIDVEYKRLNNEQEKLQNDIDKIDNKLNNKNFIQRAPKEIIDEQTERKQNIISQVDRINLALQKMNQKFK